MFEDLITDRTLEDVQNRTAKGHYNASDLNRVEHAAKQISELLTKEAYPVVYQPHKRLVNVDTEDKNTLLLIHSGGLADKSKYRKNITNEGVTTSTTQSKFGDASLYFNGNARLLIDNDETLNFSDKDFTIDWWEYSSTASNKTRFNTHYSDTYWTGMVWGYNGTSCYIQSTATTSNWDLLNNWPGMDVVQNQWVHRAVVRRGNDIISFKNGQIALQTTISGAIYHNASFKFVIGDYIIQDHNQFTGYIDEFRVSNIARWTSEFMPATARYTSDDNTVMLINAEVSDGGLYDRTLINDGVIDRKNNGSLNETVMYFDGASKIKLPIGDWLKLNNTPFTIEWRENTESFSGGNSFTLAGTNDNNFLIYYTGSELTFYFSVNNIVHFAGVSLAPMYNGVWVHRALVFTGVKFLFFTNGVKNWEADYSGDIITTTNYQSCIGGREDTLAPNQFFKGCIEEFRISDVARYTENFTPPTKPFENNSSVKWDENTLFLLNGNEILDESKYGLNITNNGVVVTTDQSKFGDKSLYFNGSSYLKIDEIIPTSGDFTVEWWEYCTGNSATRFAQSINGGVSGICAGGGYNTNALFVSSTGTSWDMVNQLIAFDTNTSVWTHWAVVRNGSKWSTYKNGVSFNSAVSDGTIYKNNGGLYIGTFLYDSNHYFVGYMNGIRISNIARYTSDFTPPTEPFVAKTDIGGDAEYIEGDWVEPEKYKNVPDHPTATEMARYLNNIKEIKRQFYQKKSTPELPREMDRLRHTGANAIEQLIIDTNDRLIDVEKIKRKSGTFKAGELLP